MSRIASILSLYLLFTSQVLFADDRADDEQGMAKAHAEDEPVATPVAATMPAVRVDSRAVVYTQKDGKDVSGWLAWPAGAPEPGRPGIIVIHEWWGLNDNIRATAERLAGEGYVTLAVDLYAGKTAEAPKEAMELSSRLSEEAEPALANLEAAYDYLHRVSAAEKIGIVGWCLGGKWSLRGALRMPAEIDAMVMYYGGVVTDKEELATLEMPILGHFASTDPVVPPDTVEAFAAGLEELGKDARVYIYPNTKHAFSNPSGLAYNKDAADLAWSRTVEFFAKNLQ